MEVVFMDHPEQQRNNMKPYLLILFVLAIATWFCFIHAAAGDLKAPSIWINANDTMFERRLGVVYLDKQPFSGYQFALYEKRDTAFITPFINGRESGIAMQWYPNKQLKETGNFLNGKKTGEHIGWWENGAIKFVYHFTQDVFEGQVKEWYVNGQLYRNMNYENGHEKGLQQIWQPDGSLFANYEARNGRNYGLTGTMHCKNVNGEW